MHIQYLIPSVVPLVLCCRSDELLRPKDVHSSEVNCASLLIDVESVWCQIFSICIQLFVQIFMVHCNTLTLFGLSWNCGVSHGVLLKCFAESKGRSLLESQMHSQLTSKLIKTNQSEAFKSHYIYFWILKRQTNYYTVCKIYTIEF